MPRLLLRVFLPRHQFFRLAFFRRVRPQENPQAAFSAPVSDPTGSAAIHERGRWIGSLRRSGQIPSIGNRSTARPANLILGQTGEPFWQDESFDHRVHDEVELDRIAHYVEYHPVSAGLTANPHAWHWSSARLAGESAGESACPTIGANPDEM
jgi:hypothetical protein